MIRNVIKASILIAVLVPTGSITQVAVALDLNIDSELSSVNHYPFAWAPEAISLDDNQHLRPIASQYTKKSLYDTEVVERNFSFKIYSGDGLDQLREKPGVHSKGIFPKEDTDTYGISINQRF